MVIWLLLLLPSFLLLGWTASCFFLLKCWQFKIFIMVFCFGVGAGGMG